MTYHKVIQYLNTFTNYEKLSEYSYKKSFQLGPFQKFLKFINNPHSGLNVIHVAGSKGKGSVCAFIANILKEAGFKVGLYTSPHLNDFRERIRILHKTKGHRLKTKEFEGMISKQEICDLVFKLKPSIDKFNNNSKHDALTCFEVYTALAFQYFKNKKVDFVILETGLGGRFDATNACRSLLSIITPISYEHTMVLGNRLRDIAYEKASIIKKENKSTKDNKILAITSKQDRYVMDVIEKIAENNNAILFKEGKDFKFSIREDYSFDYVGLSSKVDNLRLNLLGRHQVANASLAIASVESLRYHSINIDKSAIRDGLNNCFWPARFESISKNPLVILDGAQNSASVKALYKTLEENFPNKKIWIIFSLFKDKELKDTCRQIEKISDRIILTKVNNPRASEPEDLLKYFKGNSIFLTNSSEEALELAKTKASRKDLILITGSLYLCGEVRLENK
ncbi:bifunctional folylpolyglutamate synthase/dihydrofolate synthase [bacterium]|nr:bifunctional folylpolyglutamate synthase/dihydrofolate synthase [bacterium]